MTPQKQTPTTGQVAGASKFHKSKQSLSLFIRSFNAAVFAPLYSVIDVLTLVLLVTAVHVLEVLK